MADAGILLGPGEGTHRAVSGFEATFKVVDADTGGSHAVIETTIPADFAGPPPHVHRAMDEGFYVLAGELTVRVGERTATVPAGGAFVPRGVAHTFANRGATPATFLDMVYPAGFEHYYRDLAAAGGMPRRETFAALLAKYDTDSVP